MIDPLPIARALLLLAAANSMPIFAKKLLGDRWAWPLDAGRTFVDGRPLFGASKTIRGIAFALGSTGILAPLLGLDWMIGAATGAAAMIGDLASSFIKRRLGLALHAQAFGLDQVPESLLPMVLLQARLSLSFLDIAVTLVLFVALEELLSRLFFALHIRDRPY